MNKPGSPETRKTAVTLAYHATDPAPKVVAKGMGNIAQSIIELAKQHNVPVHESPELVAMLMQVDLDQQIPPELYTVVAELLAWIYSLEAGLERN